MPNHIRHLIGAVILLPLLAADVSEPKGKNLPALRDLPAIKELPDPFLFQDGSRVKTREDWQRRRDELKTLIQHYEYGYLPPAPGNVEAQETGSKEISGAVEKQYTRLMGPEHRIRTTLHLTIPNGKGPFPVVITGDLSWGKLDERAKGPAVAEMIKRGYMLAEFNRTEIAPDKKEDRGGIWQIYSLDDSSALAAWAWGYHRVIDYLLTRPDVQKDHIAATGHSRGGKATLLAGAFDERIALTVPNNSGCGGAGCYRLQAAKSEDIAAITKNFPYWFHPRFRDFIGQVDKLPFDQHSLKALVAPRAYLSTEALGDLWANPEGTQQAHAAAKEVFDFLGAGDKAGIYFREGKHEHNYDDWVVLLDFADKVFFNKPTQRDFNKPAFPDAKKSWSWSKPQ